MKVKKLPKPTGSMVAGLPTYSPAQFQQVRPGGSYQSYLNYINRRRGVTAGPKWPGRGGPGLPTIESMIRNVAFETPAQVEARATRMTNQQVAAQKGLIVDEAKRAQADAIRRSDASAAAGRAAANLNQGLFASVGGEYNRAAQELANMGTGVIGAATAATDANVAATNEALARVGAPGIEATGAMAGPAQAGVAAYRSAGLPAQRIAEAGEAAQFGLAGMVGAQNLRATQEAEAGLAQAGHTIQQNRQQAMAEIARGRPEIAAKFLQQLQEAQRQQTALGMSLLEARRAALQTGFTQGITKQTTAQSIKESNARIKEEENKLLMQADAAGIEGSRIDASASRVAGILIDRNGKPILGKNGQPIPVAKSGSGGKNAAGLTPYQQQNQLEKAQDRIKTLYYGYKTTNARIDPKTGKAIPGTGKRLPAWQAPGFNEDDPNTYGDGAITYQNAIARIQQLQIPRAQATALANELYERGDQGRPWFTAPEQKKIKAKLNAIFGAKQGPQEWNRQITAIQRAFAEAEAAYKSGNNAAGTA